MSKKDKILDELKELRFVLNETNRKKKLNYSKINSVIDEAIMYLEEEKVKENIKKKFSSRNKLEK